MESPIKIEIEIGIGIEIGIEIGKCRVKPMGLGHEKLDVYRLVTGYVAPGSTRKPTAYDGNPIDPDSDSDLDETKPQQRGGGDGIPPPHR